MLTGLWIQKQLKKPKSIQNCFFIKTKDAVSRITEEQVKNIREALKKEASAK